MSGRIGVIGGSGFIGCRLVRSLLEGGREVAVVDAQQSERHPDRTRICDVRDAEGLRKACEDAEVIYNLAAEHRDDVRPISLYDEVNVGGARNTVAAAEASGISKIVFVSSVAVYGFSDKPVSEDAPKEPFNEYGRTKLEAEGIYQEWQARDPTRCLVVVRPTVVFGEGNRGNVYNLLHQLAHGPFLMIGSGANFKSMAYVENIVGFLDFVLRFGPGVHIFNYVDKPDMDMNTLVRVSRTALGRPGRVRMRLPYAAGWAAGALADVVAAATRRSLPISRIRVRKFCASTVYSSDLMLASGYQPSTSLEEALRRTIVHEFGGGRNAEENGARL